jgi:hypothetical protein
MKGNIKVDLKQIQDTRVLIGFNGPSLDSRDDNKSVRRGNFQSARRLKAYIHKDIYGSYEQRRNDSFMFVILFRTLVIDSEVI